MLGCKDGLEMSVRKSSEKPAYYLQSQSCSSHLNTTNMKLFKIPPITIYKLLLYDPEVIPLVVLIAFPVTVGSFAVFRCLRLNPDVRVSRSRRTHEQIPDKYIEEPMAERYHNSRLRNYLMHSKYYPSFH